MTFWLHTPDAHFLLFSPSGRLSPEPSGYEISNSGTPKESGKSQEKEKGHLSNEQKPHKKNSVPVWKSNIRKQPRFWAFLGYILNARAEWLPVLSEQEETGVAKRALSWRGTSSHCPRWHFHELGAVYYFSFSPRTEGTRHQNCMGLTE